MSHSQQGDQAIQLTNNKEMWQEMTYAGVLSLLRRKYSKQLSADIDVVVSGIPFDNAVTYRPGCRFGPQAIRQASVQLAELSAFPYGFDPFAYLSVIDSGDCFIDPHQPKSVFETIYQHATEIVQAGCKPLTLGGDHFISYPVLKAVAEKYGSIALIQFDAHSDTWVGESERMDHGTMFTQAVDEGIIDVQHSVQVGIRTHNDSDYGFEILTTPWVHRNGVEATVQRVLQRVTNKPTYFSFDIDGLDPAFAPGTGTPVVGGLATWQAMEFIQGLGGCNWVGMDLVEVSPAYDHSEITALAAATVIYQWLCLLAMKKGAKPKSTGSH